MWADAVLADALTGELTTGLHGLLARFALLHWCRFAAAQLFDQITRDRHSIFLPKLCTHCQSAASCRRLKDFFGQHSGQALGCQLVRTHGYAQAQAQDALSVEELVVPIWFDDHRTAAPHGLSCGADAAVVNDRSSFGEQPRMGDRARIIDPAAQCGVL